MLEQASAAVNREGWQKVRFDQIATNVSERVDPRETDMERYVGLEHLDSMNLKIERWGTPSDVKGTKFLFRNGDIIFGKRRFYQKKLAVADFEGICSAHSMVLRHNEDFIVEDLLPFFMQTETFFERAMDISVGSLSPTISWKTLAKQEFVIPPIEKQRVIAELLWEAENSIENADDKIDRSAKLKIGLMNELLNKGTGHTNFKKVKWLFGKKLEIPKNWKFRKLIEISEIFDSLHATPEFTSEGVPMIRSTDIKYGNLDLEMAALVSEKVYDNFTKKYKPRRGDIVMSRVGTYFATSFVNTDERFCIGQNTLIIHPLNSSLFLYYVMNSIFIQKQIEILFNKTTGQKSLRLEYIKKILVFLPPLPEQEQIASILSDADAKIDALRAHREKLVALKASLIETLLDGDVTEN